MNGTISQINTIIMPGSYQTIPDTPAQRPFSDTKRYNVGTSSKYIVENHKIVFERYDRHGKLISRVPWSADPINEKA
jgi:hypothetical protein